MSLSGTKYLGHILEEVEYLVGRTTGLEREAFLKGHLIHGYFGVDLVLGERIRELLEEGE